MAKRVIISLFLFSIIGKFSFAQKTEQDLQKVIHFTATISPAYGFVIPHDIMVSNTAGTKITGIELKLNRIREDAEAKRYAGKSFNTGYTFAFYHFSKSFLGNALYASYFVQPYLINQKKFRLGLVAKLGLSYNSNPYNEVSNNQNNSYSLFINPYLCLGLNAEVLTNGKTGLNVDVMFNHNSNGGIYHPNYGINFPTASLGLVYDLQKVSTAKIIQPFNPKWRFDVSPFICYKTIPMDRTHFYGIYGLSLQGAGRLGFFNTVTMGVEWVNDKSAKKTMQSEGNPQLDFRRVGILAGHEFIFKRFNFTQQIGWYLHNEVPYITRLYHRWGLYYKFNNKFMAGFSLSAHKQVADFLDMRFIYSKAFEK